nr:RecQ family zinc-binding domain-containing protein [Acholeplasmatales bacterium]
KGIHGIIYCLTIKNVIHVYEYLKNLGYMVTYYHGNLEPNIKKQNQDDYTLHKYEIMVATNAFGMGIDIPDIRYVIMYDLPSSIEDFSQQSGRGSRDGLYAEAIILFNLKDIEVIKYFIDNISNNEKNQKELKIIKKERYNQLDQIVNLCISGKCIHQRVVNYFGLPHSGKCNMCSNCKRLKKK